MKTKLLLVLLLLVTFISCNNNKKDAYKKSESVVTELATENKETAYTSKGYKLMQQKCFICHFEKPDPARRDQMLAPPFLRVQEHYKPTYPIKDEFITAVMEIINNPSEENTLMPGAVRKFNLMPKLVYDQEELRLIAEALYDVDYGSALKMRMNQDLQMNNGEKWKLSQETMSQINVIVNDLNDFKSDDILVYNQLGKDVFNDAKVIMLDDSYEGELWEQIHNFFSDIEDNMHSLMATKSLIEAENEVAILKIKFKEFTNYFE